MLDPQAEAVRRYYDANTRLFLLADLGGVGAIHRQVWAPGTRTTAEAASHVHERVASFLPRGEKVIDLGCGVGATSRFLERRLAADVTGVTLSPVQAAAAAKAAGGSTCTFLVRNYLSLQGLGPFSGAVAIESFSHAADASRFFASVASVLTPGAVLCVCDDFLAPGQHGRGSAARFARLRRGWHFASFDTAQRAIAAAAAHGFTLRAREDFTAHLRLRPRWQVDLLARAERVLRRLPFIGASSFVDNWEGGTALQECEHRGESTYELLIFTRGGGQA
jgi:cyclopropane fatty-acyl-phospholipid synthase-like methyltransferase